MLERGLDGKLSLTAESLLRQGSRNLLPGGGRQAKSSLDLSKHVGGIFA